jgi:hypothetical protein
MIQFPFKLSTRQSLYIYGFVFCIASILITGYAVYIENQALQIPLVHWINNPSLYPHDLFTETLRYYASPLWYLVAFVSRIIPLEPLLFGLFVLERLLVIFAAGYLAYTFAPKSKLAVVGAMAIFALGLSGPTLGGNQLVINYFEQTGLSIPFFLLAFAAFYQKKSGLVAVWMAIGFNCNSMFGVYALTYLGAVFILDVSYRSHWKKWLLSFVLFLLLAAPAIFLTLAAFGRKAGNETLWYIASKVRFPHHLFPLTWNKIEFGKYGVLIFLVLAFLYQNRHQFRQLFDNCKIWAGVSFLWLIYAFIAAYVAKSPSMLVMHPGRALTLWYGVASIALVSVCAVKLETTKGTQRRAFLLGIFIASILIWHPIIGPYILAVGLMVLAIKPVWYWLLDRGNSNRLALLLTISVLVFGLSQLNNNWQKTGNLTAAIIQKPSSNIEEIAIWAKKNTPLDSVFLVNYGLEWQQFRAQSERPVFMNWKDGSAILWDRSFIEPWVERLNAIGLDITEKDLTLGKAVNKLNKLYQKLDDEKIQQLKYNYKLDFGIVSRDSPSKFPIIFQNQDFKVLDLNN